MPSDLDRLERALSDRCPEIGSVHGLRPIGAGFDSHAYVTPGGFVVRVARNEKASRSHSMEAALLPAIRSRLPIDVPDIRCRVDPCPDVPFGATTHRMLEGRALEPSTAKSADLDRIASDLAGFLHALHRIPAAEARRLGVPERGLRELAAQREPVTSLLESALPAPERRVMDRWWDEMLSDPALAAVDPSFVHADLWYVHILVDRSGGRVAGILDFGDACIADPAADFAPMLYSGRDFTALVVDAYQKAGGDLGASFDRRLRRCWEIREVEGLPYVARHHPAELREDIEKLLHGPILDPGAVTW